MSEAVPRDDARLASAARPPAPPSAQLRPWWRELSSVLPRSVVATARAARPPSPGAVPAMSANPISWATVALDELTVSTAYLLSRRNAEARTSIVLDDAVDAVERLSAFGVIDDPWLAHPEPATPVDVRLTRRSRAGIDFEQLSFPSTYRLPIAVPGTTAWEGVAANRSAHAYLLRHRDGPRPWLVVLHGHRMGEPVDLRLLGSRKLHAELGVDVAHLVLPMHGPRGRDGGHPFPGVDPVANLLGLAQAASDARALIAWLRAEADLPVGVFGVSLGGHVAALLAAMDDRLACVVAGVPTSDTATMLADTMRSRWGEDAVVTAHVLDAAPCNLSRLVSPLTFAPVVARDRLFLYAAVGDRLVTPQQALALWRHWDQPTILWLQGGHILNNVNTSRHFVADALTASGVTGR